MVDGGTYAAGGLLIAFACYRVAAGRYRERDPALGYICWFALSIGAALLVLAPRTMAALDRFGPVPRVGTLLAAELKLSGLTALAMFAASLGEPGRRTQRRLTAGYGAAAALLAVLFVPAGLHGGDPGHADGPWFLAGYDLLFVAYALHCLLMFTTVLGRHARRMPPSALRTGLVLMKASGLVGAVWTLWLLTDVVQVLRDGRQDVAEDAQSAALALLCAVLAVAGATAAAWGRVLTAPVRLVRARRAYRALGPLWSALHEAHPAIELLPAAAVRSWHGGTPKLRHVQFALYRRVIEIHDGRLSLRAYYPDDVPAWLAERGAAREGRGGGEPESGGEHGGGVAAAVPKAAFGVPDAAVEAAGLAAAVEARRSGRRPPHRTATAAAAWPRVGTIDGDVAWLLAVAEVFAALTAAGGPPAPAPDSEEPRPGRGDQAGAVPR